MQKAKKQLGQDFKMLHSIERIGGGTRIPVIQELVKEIFN